MSFFKTKKFYLLIIAALLVGGLSYRHYQQKNAPPVYETVLVERGTIEQTVEATGKVESADTIELHFELSGTVNDLRVKEGSKVKQGQLLAALKQTELNAAVAQAQANLNLKLASITAADRQYYEAAVLSAKAAWEQTKIEGAAGVTRAQSALETAKNNLKLAQGGDNSQLVTEAYEDAVIVLHASLSTLDDAINQADNILGIDNTFANESFKTHLGNLDASKKSIAEQKYLTTRTERNRIRPLLLALTATSPQLSIDDSLRLVEGGLSMTNQLLATVADLLNATLPLGNLTQALLDAKKTTIENTRAAVTAKNTTVINQRQAIAEAKNSFASYTISYAKAQKDLIEAEATAINNAKIKEAAYLQAQATLQGKVANPREVDIGSLRAALAQAVAQRDKARLVAPIDGVVTKIYKKRGEAASSAEPAMQLLSPHFQVTVDMPETDVPKLKENQRADITLDAFGKEARFAGTIATIDPASTEIQDVVYYQVTIRLSPSDKSIKPGMTANVVVHSALHDNVLLVPSRAIHTTPGASRGVTVLENGEEKEIPVTVGIRSADGRTEIISGLNEGQEVIVSKEEKK